MELLLKGCNNEEDDNISSPQKIQESLNTMQLAAVSTSHGEKFIKVKPHSLAKKIFKRLGIGIPSNISTENDPIGCFKLDAEPSPVQVSIL